MKEKYKVIGMTCAACQAAVNRSVKKVQGVTEVNVNLMSNSMIVEGDFDVNAVIKAVEKAGYGAERENNSLKSDDKSNKTTVKSEEEFNKSVKRFVISLCFLVPVMVLAMLNMFADKINFSDGLLNAFFGGKGAFNLAFAEFILTLPILYLNRDYFIKGFKSLFHLSPNMDTLIAVGSGAAVVYGIIVIFKISASGFMGDYQAANALSMSLYFESAGMVVTLITLGKMLEAKSKKRATDSISKLIDLKPKTAEIIKNGEVITVKADDLAVGDISVIKEGSVVAADGKIISGSVLADESNLTGESMPKELTVGDRVLSGSVILGGYAEFTAEKVGENSSIARLAALVEEAANSKAPEQKLADKIAGVFVPIVMGIAAVTLIVWLILGYGFDFSLNLAISVLVISCPCALGLATPVAIMVGTGEGAKHGILIKNGEAFSLLSKVKTVALDKTGTITKGKPEITDVIVFSGSEKEIVSAAAALENKSSHVLAAAVVNYAAEHGIEIIEATDFSSETGKGIRGKIGNDDYFIGKPQGDLPKNILGIIDELSQNAKTPVIVSKNGEIIGILAAVDKEKTTARNAVTDLKKLNVTPVMITGDREKTAKIIAESVGIDEVYAETLPEEKGDAVDLMKKGGLVAFVGDGVNDAVPLKRADVGIAIGSGSEIAVDSGDVVITGSDLNALPKAVRLSRKVLSKIKGNLFWAFFYNALCIPIAAGVLYAPFNFTLNPMIGALAMSFSSVFVVLNSLGIKIKENKKMTKTIKIEGMMCEHCKMRVEKALSSVSGVSNVKVDLKLGTAEVTLASEVDDKILTSKVTEQGYDVTYVK